MTRREQLRLIDNPVYVDTDQAERELTLTLKIRTYGSVAQAKSTAERVREMLSVEFHQEVQLVGRSMKEVWWPAITPLMVGAPPRGALAPSPPPTPAKAWSSGVSCTPRRFRWRTSSPASPRCWSTA